MIIIMKRILTLFLCALSQLLAGPILYEGFHPEDEDAESRSGWMTGWHRLAGEVGSLQDSLGVPGLTGTKGALLLEEKGEALAQVGVDVSGTFYGSFRIRTAELKKDSLLGLVFAKPDLEELNPKTGTISLIVKGWRMDHGLIISNGKAAKGGEGAPIEAKQTYVVLFKVENPESGPSSVQMWILNKDQMLYHANRDVTDAALNRAALGSLEGGVMQRLQLDAKSKS